MLVKEMIVELQKCDPNARLDVSIDISDVIALLKKKKLKDLDEARLFTEEVMVNNYKGKSVTLLVTNPELN